MDGRSRLIDSCVVCELYLYDVEGIKSVVKKENSGCLCMLVINKEDKKKSSDDIEEYQRELMTLGCIK